MVLKDLTKYKAGTAMPIITTTDSTINVTVKKTASLHTDFVYQFDKVKKCKSERVITGCDSCIKKWLQATLRIGKYGWKKINENQYISKYEYKMMIELPVKPDEHYYTILRMDWSKTLYDILVGK